LLKEGPGKKSWKCLPLLFNKSIRDLLQRHLKNQKEQNYFYESSNSSGEDMSTDHITISTTDQMDSPSKKLMDKMDKDKTYQSRIENLGAITNEY
jgi:hypothetical protein